MEQGNPDVQKRARRRSPYRVASAIALLSIAAAAGGSAACSSDAPKPPYENSTGPAQPGVGGSGGGTGDGGNRDSGTTPVSDGGDAATTCTALVNSGALVDQMAIADNFPNGTGGTILDGIYVISDAKVYVGIGGQPGLTNNSYQGAISITGQTYERVLFFKNSGGVATETRVSGTIVPNAVNATIALACPNEIQESVTFTVGTNILTIGNIVTKEVFIFTKKP
jgi:hypothetical protein